jgi:hypothetical protein
MIKIKKSLLPPLPQINQEPKKPHNCQVLTNVSDKSKIPNFNIPAGKPKYMINYYYHI